MRAFDIFNSGVGLIDATGAEEDGGYAEAAELAGIAAKRDAADRVIALHGAEDVARKRDERVGGIGLERPVLQHGLFHLGDDVGMLS